MRFKKNMSAEKKEFLKEQLRQYRREMPMTKEELQELEEWVSNGRSPYDNGDYIYTEYGYPMDFVSALRAQKEQNEWFTSLTPEEQEKELNGLRTDYDTNTDDIVMRIIRQDLVLDPNEEMPFS